MSLWSGAVESWYTTALTVVEMEVSSTANVAFSSTFTFPSPIQVFLSGIFRLISVFYLWSFSNIIKREHEKKTAAATRTKTE